MFAVFFMFTRKLAEFSSDSSSLLRWPGANDLRYLFPEPAKTALMQRKNAIGIPHCEIVIGIFCGDVVAPSLV
jgi:hypothetical protein